MAAISQQTPLLTPPRGGIRTVVADFQAARRDAVHRVLMGEIGYQVIASIGSPEECRQVVTHEVPELVICTAPFVWESTLTEDRFPLFITLGRAGVSPERLVCALDEPYRESDVREALAAATVRILNIKAGELSNLIYQYVLHCDTVASRLKSVTVEQDGNSIELATHRIRWIKAAGNSVTLYSDCGTFELRESIGSIAARLERSGFLRIHRGVVVNSNALRFLDMLGDVRQAVVLADGTRLPVGPNFRDQVPAELPVFSQTAVTENQRQ